MERFIKYCMGDDECRDLYSTVWGDLYSTIWEMMNEEIYKVLYGDDEWRDL
jgi:hypothetical protein